MAQNLTASTLFFALAGGFIPSLLWLWFWLKEDSHPEPRANLIYTFIAGMIVVPIAMVFEYIALFPLGLTGKFFPSCVGIYRRNFKIWRCEKNSFLQILF